MSGAAKQLLSEWQQHILCAPFGNSVGRPQIAPPVKAKYRWRVYLTEDLYLTRREYDCARLLDQSYSNYALGEKLQLSPRTVEFHMTAIRKKLNCCHYLQLLTVLRQYSVLPPRASG